MTLTSYTACFCSVPSTGAQHLIKSVLSATEPFEPTRKVKKCASAESTFQHYLIKCNFSNAVIFSDITLSSIKTPTLRNVLKQVDLNRKQHL